MRDPSSVRRGTYFGSFDPSAPSSTAPTPAPLLTASSKVAPSPGPHVTAAELMRSLRHAKASASSRSHAAPVARRAHARAATLPASDANEFGALRELQRDMIRCSVELSTLDSAADVACFADDFHALAEKTRSALLGAAHEHLGGILNVGDEIRSIAEAAVERSRTVALATANEHLLRELDEARAERDTLAGGWDAHAQPWLESHLALEQAGVVNGDVLRELDGARAALAAAERRAAVLDRRHIEQRARLEPAERRARALGEVERKYTALQATHNALEHTRGEAAAEERARNTAAEAEATRRCEALQRDLTSARAELESGLEYDATEIASLSLAAEQALAQRSAESALITVLRDEFREQALEIGAYAVRHDAAVAVAVRGDKGCADAEGSGVAARAALQRAQREMNIEVASLRARIDVKGREVLLLRERCARDEDELEAMRGRLEELKVALAAESAALAAGEAAQREESEAWAVERTAERSAAAKEHAALEERIAAAAAEVAQTRRKLDATIADVEAGRAKQHALEELNAAARDEHAELEAELEAEMRSTVASATLLAGERNVVLDLRRIVAAREAVLEAGEASVVALTERNAALHAAHADLRAQHATTCGALDDARAALEAEKVRGAERSALGESAAAEVAEGVDQSKLVEARKLERAEAQLAAAEKREQASINEYQGELAEAQISFGRRASVLRETAARAAEEGERAKGDALNALRAEYSAERDAARRDAASELDASNEQIRRLTTAHDAAVANHLAQLATTSASGRRATVAHEGAVVQMSKIAEEHARGVAMHAAAKEGAEMQRAAAEAKLDAARAELVSARAEWKKRSRAEGAAAARALDAAYEEASTARDVARGAEATSLEALVERDALRHALSIVERPNATDTAEVDLLVSAALAEARHSETLHNALERLDAEVRAKEDELSELAARLSVSEGSVVDARTAQQRSEAQREAFEGRQRDEFDAMAQSVATLHARLSTQGNSGARYHALRRDATAALKRAGIVEESPARDALLSAALSDDAIVDGIAALRVRCEASSAACDETQDAELASRYAAFRAATCRALGVADEDGTGAREMGAESAAAHIVALRERVKALSEVHAGMETMHDTMREMQTKLEVQDSALDELEALRSATATLQAKLDERDAAIHRFVDLHDGEVARAAASATADEEHVSVRAMLVAEARACEENLVALAANEASTTAALAEAAAAAVLVRADEVKARRQPVRVISRRRAAREGDGDGDGDGSSEHVRRRGGAEAPVPSSALRRRISALKKELFEERERFAIELALRDNAIETFAAKSTELKAAWKTQLRVLEAAPPRAGAPPKGGRTVARRQRGSASARRS